jgi:hypothetical protein
MRFNIGERHAHMTYDCISCTLTRRGVDLKFLLPLTNTNAFHKI